MAFIIIAEKNIGKDLVLAAEMAKPRLPPVASKANSSA